MCSLTTKNVGISDDQNCEHRCNDGFDKEGGDGLASESNENFEGGLKLS